MVERSELIVCCDLGIHLVRQSDEDVLDGGSMYSVACDLLAVK